MAKGVEDFHKDYIKASRKWKRVRDCVAGEDAIHAAGTAYLRKLKYEPQADYVARVDRTPFYNATGRTVIGFMGMLFRKEPQIKVPDAIKPFLDDISQAGQPFAVFARKAGNELLQPTRVGILVDHPPAPPGDRTVAEAEALGLRPRMVMYTAEAIRNWDHRMIGNKFTLSEVRLTEEYNEPGASEFERKCGVQIRVLDLNEDAGNTYRQRVYRQDTKQAEWMQFGEDIIPFMNNKPLTYIPFECIGSEGISFEVSKCATEDLATTNVKHYQVSSSYENGCFMAGVPTPVIAGLEAEVDEATGKKKPHEIYLGSTKALVFSNKDTTAKFMEFTGQGLTELRTNLDSKKAEMAALGARMLAPEKAGVEASDTMLMRHAGEQSVLANIALSLSLGLTQALKWVAEWSGIDAKDIEVKINRQFFPVSMDSATLTAIVGAWQQGAISEAEMFSLLQEGDMIQADKTLEDHQGEIDAAPPLSKLMGEAALEGIKNPPDDPNKDKPPPKKE